MAKLKSNVKTNNINFVRICDLSIVPLNQLQTLSKSGYCVVMIKQGVDSNLPDLTDKERKCLKLYTDGFPAKAIAQDVGVSIRTIRQIMVSLRQKFRVNTNIGLVSKIYQMGIDGML